MKFLILQDRNKISSSRFSTIHVSWSLRVKLLPAYESLMCTQFVGIEPVYDDHQTVEQVYKY